jgi:hypothetical protein
VLGAGAGGGGGGGWYGNRLRDHAGLSPPLAASGWLRGRPSESRRSSSCHGMSGLVKPTAGWYEHMFDTYLVAAGS